MSIPDYTDGPSPVEARGLPHGSRLSAAAADAPVRGLRRRGRVPIQRRGPSHELPRVDHVHDADLRIGTVRIDDVPISSASEVEIVEHVMAALDARRGGVIATPNVDIMRGMARGRGAHVARDADLLVPDGMPLIWASRLQRQPLRARVTGADLFWSLSGAAAGREKSVFLLGGAPGVGSRAAEALMAHNDGLRVVGASSPSQGFEQNAEMMAEVEQELLDASPDIVFVALGFPKQEQLALRLRGVLPHAWFLGCGGAIDMAAGDKQRAPRVFQLLGLEWAHRLALEPGRLWQRYLVHDLPYVFGLLARSTRRGFSRRVEHRAPAPVALPNQRRAGVDQR